VTIADTIFGWEKAVMKPSLIVWGVFIPPPPQFFIATTIKIPSGLTPLYYAAQLCGATRAAGIFSCRGVQLYTRQTCCVEKTGWVQRKRATEATSERRPNTENCRVAPPTAKRHISVAH
jgi:hypothetical protein